MVIILVAPLMFLEELNENFLVHPWLDLNFGIIFVIALEGEILFLVLVFGVLLIVLHEKADDLLRPVFHPLHIKIDLGSDLVLRGSIFLGWVGVSVMDRTAVAAGDDHSFPCLFLDEIQQIQQDTIDIFFAGKDREAMASGGAVEKGNGLLRVAVVLDRRVDRAAFAPEKLLGDPGKVGLRLPRIQASGGVDRILDRSIKLIVATVDRLAFAIAKAHFFTFRLLQTGASGKNDSQDYWEMTYSPARGTGHG